MYQSIRHIAFKRLAPLGLLALMSLSNCGGTTSQHPVPYIAVDESIYLNSPSAYDIQFVGGHMTLPTKGYSGIVIYRRSNYGDANDFAVYDMACPNHVNDPCGTLQVDGLYGNCGCDDQQFLIYDGQALDGVTAWGLRPYRITYQGQSIRITGY